MKRFGYHTMLLRNGTEIEGPLVVEIQGGRLLSWHPLLREEANVEWRGGTYFE